MVLEDAEDICLLFQVPQMTGKETPVPLWGPLHHRAHKFTSWGLIGKWQSMALHDFRRSHPMRALVYSGRLRSTGVWKTAQVRL